MLSLTFYISLCDVYSPIIQNFSYFCTFLKQSYFTIYTVRVLHIIWYIHWCEVCEEYLLLLPEKCLNIKIVFPGECTGEIFFTLKFVSKNLKRFIHCCYYYKLQYSFSTSSLCCLYTASFSFIFALVKRYASLTIVTKSSGFFEENTL